MTYKHKNATSVLKRAKSHDRTNKMLHASKQKKENNVYIKQLSLNHLFTNVPISICFSFMFYVEQGIEEHYKENLEKTWTDRKDQFGGRQKGKR